MIESGIKTYFTITVNDYFLKDACPFLKFSDYRLVENIDEISDGNLFDTFAEAALCIADIYNCHKLFCVGDAYKLSIKTINKVSWAELIKNMN